MEPGDRVAMKYDKRFHYGTVIPGQYRNNKGIVFVAWDENPNYFVAYRCNEVRKVRTNEEEQFPEAKGEEQ